MIKNFAYKHICQSFVSFYTQDKYSKLLIEEDKLMVKNIFGICKISYIGEINIRET